MKQFQLQIKDIFKNHPKENKVYVTCDGQIFFAKNHADGHASELEFKESKEVTREEAEAWLTEEETEESLDALTQKFLASVGEEKAAEEKATAEKALAEKEAADKAAEEKATAEKAAAEDATAKAKKK